MSLLAEALVTLAEAKSYLRIDGSSEDTLLETLINGSTHQLETYTGRKLKSRTYTAEDYDGTGTPELILREYPVSSVASVNMDRLRQFGAGTAVSLELLTVSGDEGRLTFTPGYVSSGLGIARFLTGTKVVRITYTAGYATVPDDLKLACLKVVAIHFAHSREGADGVVSESIGGRSIVWVDGLPKTVTDMLMHYRRLGGI